MPWLFSACGQCEYCITGWETLCESQQNGGYSVDGSYAEYVVADARYVAHFPEGMNLAESGSHNLCRCNRLQRVKGNGYKSR